jgi:hypothetical protein
MRTNPDYSEAIAAFDDIRDAEHYVQQYCDDVDISIESVPYFGGKENE